MAFRKKKEMQRHLLAQMYRAGVQARAKAEYERQCREILERQIAKVVPAEYASRKLEWATAYHESAHAVIAEIVGFAVDWVTCQPLVHEGEPLLGICMLATDEAGQVPALGYIRIGSLVVQTLAGIAAEYKLGTMSRGEIPATDIAVIRHILNNAAIAQSEWLSTTEATIAHTEMLIGLPDVWNAIVVLALKLLATRSKISGDEVRAIVKQHVRPEHIISEANQLRAMLAPLRGRTKYSDEEIEFIEQASRRLREIAA